MIKRKELEKFLNKTLDIYSYQDYGPNGLQIEGKENIKKIAFAVSATKKSIEQALEHQADALIVHHGLFWKFHGPKTITKSFHKRVAPLIKADINLFGYHLPLDAHLEYGNAANLAKDIGLINLKPFGDYKGMPTGVWGKFQPPIKVKDLNDLLEKKLNRKPINSALENSELQTIGIITGGANGDWVLARKLNLDGYITGEMSEHDWHESQEDGVVSFAAGHNATERYGVKALQLLLQEKYELDCFFIDSENPA